jgi:hypothetical protein
VIDLIFGTMARLAAIIGIAASAQAIANSPLPLFQTILYANMTHDCRRTELSSWSNSIGKIFSINKVTVQKTELCNDGRYTIYTVHFKYDPRAQTSKYFHPLYAAVAQANGFLPFSFVDVDDNVIVNVRIDQKHALSISYEDYR